jgi:hypothetical protein
VGQGIEPVRVAAVLADDDLGLEGAHQLRDHGVEGPQPAGVPRSCRQSHVNGAAQRLGAADLVGEAGAGEQGHARFVQRDGEDAGVVPEDALRPVAVVGVDVDICHPLHAAVEQFPDRQGGIVVDAKAAGAVP